MPQNKKNILKKILPETGNLVSRLVYILASTTARWSIIGLSLLIIGYLGYGWVWVPLQKTDILPPGVSLTGSTDSNLLQTINNQRAERSQHIPYDFRQESQIIAPNRGGTTANGPAN